MNVDRIIVTDRYRADLGDVSDLASSIAIHGLLHPIVVTTEGHLIAGQRRLEAVKLLGWTSVQVTYVENVTDAADLLCMERDENTCRKDMTASEKVALGRALEELERPKAREAQRSAGVANLPTVSSVRANGTHEKFDTREVVAPAVGMSTATYSRAKQLVTAAEQVAEMDRTGKVTPAYEAWKGERVNRGEAAPTRRDTFGLAPKTSGKKNVKNHKGRDPIRAMEGAINTLVGLTMPMGQLTANDFDGLSDETRRRWEKELAKALKTLRTVHALIKENPS